MDLCCTWLRFLDGAASAERTQKRATAMVAKDFMVLVVVGLVIVGGEFWFDCVEIVRQRSACTSLLWKDGNAE